MKTENNVKEPKTESGETEKKSWLAKLAYYLGGGFFTEDFFIKQSKLLILIFFLIIFFISNRYSCIKKLSEMDRLKTELANLKNEQTNLTYRLTSVRRQASIEKLLHEKGIELTHDKATVYEIKK